ncbi:MAG TPA: TonB family protein [Thermoanaerobaculia bacterium]|nr:TonB family protein [Thermoanaerobaculia bacterium]
MRDGVADVLAERASLDRGAAGGFFVSLVLHGGLTAFGVYAAMHATPPKASNVINIEFARMPGPVTPPRAVARPVTPKPAEVAPAVPIEAPIEEPKPPRIEEPKPAAVTTPAKVEKNTVPLSPFGQSTKKGSETPPAAKPAVAPAATAALVPGTTTDVPVGGSGITGIEGGDFPHTLYLQGMHRRIGSNWFRPPGTVTTPAVIYFRIQRDGTINEAKVETSSGNATFDRAALSAVRASNRLTPLPFAYNGTFLGVHLTFR